MAAESKAKGWVWIEGGLAQDQSEDVLVIDTDQSDFVDDADLEQARYVLARAQEANVPAHVIAACEARVEDCARRLSSE